MVETEGIARLVRAGIRELAGYEPVEPVDLLVQRLGISPERMAKLDANENPYGPSPRALTALAAFDGYNIYPDPDQRRLRAALSAFIDVPSEYVLAGAGSDELIQLLVALFLERGDNALDIVPSFGMYRFEVAVADGQMVPVQRRADFSVDLDAIERAVDGRTKLILATSPNNPTGNLLTEDETDALLRLGLPLLVDEAYIEFSSGESLVGRVQESDNLIVLRTFSKWAGLAGLRVGYAVMAPSLVEYAFRIRQPYSINVAAEVAVLASLEDAHTLMQRVALIVEEREKLQAALEVISFLDPYPSEANFILCRVLEGNAREIRDRLQRLGVFIRYFDTPLLQNYLRISVGLPEHTSHVIDALITVGSDLGLRLT